MTNRTFIGYEDFYATGVYGELRICVSRFDDGFTVLDFGPHTAGYNVHLSAKDARTLFRKLGKAIGADPEDVDNLLIPNEVAEYYADSELV